MLVRYCTQKNQLKISSDSSSLCKTRQLIFVQFQACRLLSTYIDYKKCEGVAEVIVARRLLDGFRGVIQTMGLANLKPNIVCMRYPEIWRDAIHGDVPDNFFSIINDCSTANKAVVIVKGLDEWPGEYERQFGTIDLYWIVRDGGLMLLLSQLLRAKECFEHCKIQVNVSLNPFLWLQ